MNQSRINALGVYPVNELIKDQYQSLQKKLPLKKYQEVGLWTAEELRKQRLPGQSKLDVIHEMTQPALSSDSDESGSFNADCPRKVLVL